MATPVRAALTGMGMAVPSRVMTNADFEKFLDTSDEWITQRTGIKERHMASEGETTASLAADAARSALEQAGVKPVDLDLIICATVSPEMPFPSTACFVQNALKATNVPAFDISAACSGFIYGLAIADHAGQVEAELIVIPSHGYTGIKHLLLGSVAERVLRHAQCPVLILRRHDGEEDQD